ncbi:MAG: hypothetical protein ACOYM7_03205 [Paludibacter sp.]
MIRKLVFLFISTIILVACDNNNELQVYTSYAGSWKCNETGSVNGYNKPYMVNIDKNMSDTTQYIIRNFFDTGDNHIIVVKVNGSTLELLQQPIGGQILRSFSGTCIPYSQMKLNFTIYDGERDVFFESIYTRK